MATPPLNSVPPFLLNRKGGTDELVTIANYMLYGFCGLIVLICLAVIIAISYQQYHFGTPQLVEAKTVRVKVLKVDVEAKSACVQFEDVASGHRHQCAEAGTYPARSYKVGQEYLVPREIWKNKQGMYYRFPGLK